MHPTPSTTSGKISPVTVIGTAMVAVAIAWWLKPDRGRAAASTAARGPNEIVAIAATSPDPGAIQSPTTPQESAQTTTLGVGAAPANEAVSAQLGLLDPTTAGWGSEKLAAQIKKQLYKLRTRAQHPDTPATDTGVFTPSFRASVPAAASQRYASQQLRVSSADQNTERRQLDRGAFLQHVETHPGGGSLQALHFKVIKIKPGSGNGTPIEVEVFAESSWQQPGAAISQTTATWHTGWTRGEPPQLASVDVTRQESATAPAGPIFSDATGSVFPKTPKFERQVMRGIGYWSARLTRIDDMHIYGHHGIAVGDANGDGLDDLYACDGGGLPNQLYIQNGDGSLRDASLESGTDWLEDSRGALFVDLDNDGDQDLVVATVALLIFCENDGSGKFTLRGGHDGAPDAHSLCAADYDLDGLVDIYVCSYGAGRGGGATGRGFEATSPLPFNDANNGGHNLLLANHGNFSFSDVTAATGLDHNNTRWSFSAAWEDFDNDGDQDLYVANDFGRNNLYRNDHKPGGKTTFTDIAAETGVEDQASGMSVDWSDVNGDGKMDLYVGNMFSAAGSRVTFQSQFTDGRDSGYTGSIQRMARGNTLFLAGTDERFEDVSVASGVNLGRWAWASKFADLNSDGHDDIVVTNGYLTNSLPDDL